MKPVWLLEQDIFEKNLDRLHQAITDLGMDYKICNYIPFGGGIEFQKPFTLPKSAYQDPPVFAYGSLQLIKYLQREKIPVQTYCNLPQFLCSYYYPRFGDFLLQQDYALIPYGELNRRKNWLLHHLGQQGQLFIRPNDGFKSFTGKLVSEESWDRDVELLGFYDVTPETLCVTAAPQNIQEEYRFIINSEQKSIITGTCYSINNKLVDNPNDEVEQDIADYVQNVIQTVNYQPDPFWILDVAVTKNGPQVLEVGSMSCCGLYGANLHNVVQAISEYISEEWNSMQC